jgi:hypothetical protein
MSNDILQVPLISIKFFYKELSLESRTYLHNLYEMPTPIYSMMHCYNGTLLYSMTFSITMTLSRISSTAVYGCEKAFRKRADISTHV